MNIRAILWPSDFLARRIDKNYEKLSRRIKKRGWLVRYLKLFELFAFVIIGAIIALFYQKGFLVFWHVTVIILVAYLGGAITDLHAWRGLYGLPARGIGYKASFLMNLDGIYHFFIGFALMIILFS
jgi:hypothetical protein